MTSSNPPTQQSGVSGDGRDGVRKVVVNRMSLLQLEDHHIRGISQADEARLEHYVDEIMRLIDAQYNEGLEAAEGALPAKFPEVGVTQTQIDYARGSNQAIDAAREQIRALRRGAE